MKCTVVREHIITPLTQAERSVGKALTLPVLSCILLEVQNGILSVTATNLETGVRYSFPVAHSEDGRVAVPASTLSHVVASLPSGTSVCLEVEGGYLTVKSVGGVSRIAIQDAEDFPSLPTVEGGVEVMLPVVGFRDALESVAYCASSSSIKPELASVFVHPQGGMLTVVATDSFRLAEKKIPLKQATTTDPFLIPARSVQDLLRVIADMKDMVTLVMNEHQLSVTCDGAYLTLRLTAGTFPDYTAIIPKEFVTEVVVVTHDIDRVLKKATVFADEFYQTTLTIDSEAGLFSVHTENVSVGETTDTLPATLTGDSIDIRFNHRYLSDAFHAIHTDSVVLQFSGKSTPTIIRPKGDESYLYLVMPMNR